MTEVRRAGVSDAAELVRLREVMNAGLSPAAEAAGSWRETALRQFRKRLAAADPTLAAFVVDKPGRPGELASCAVGQIEQRLAGPRVPDGAVGHVGNVATDPAYRRRGYSRACLLALIDWFACRGIGQLDLHASASGEPLYAELGFVRNADPAMRLVLPTTQFSTRSDDPDYRR